MKHTILLFILLLTAVTAFGQPISGVTVNSIVGTGTVTVTTAAAHGLAVNQGFCLSAPLNSCGVVATVPTTTTLTFANGTACASSCGTIQAAKQIIVLNTTQVNALNWSANVLFWLTTTAPFPGKSSAFTGATAPELSAISAGSFVEVERSYQWSVSQPIASIKTELQNDYTAAQTTFAQSIQPGQFLGVFFNGGWSQ